MWDGVGWGVVHMYIHFLYSIYNPPPTHNLDMNLTVGDNIVPSSLDGVLLPTRVENTTNYREFCQRQDTSGVIQV